MSTWSPKAPPDAFRVVLGPSCALLGRSWAALGPLLDVLGRLGALSERSWTPLGRLLGGSWALLGAPGPPLRDLGSILDPPSLDFTPSGGAFSILRG